MNAFVACAALLFAAWLLRRRAVPRLERALIDAQGGPTVLPTLALALTRCVITLAAAAAAAYLVVAGSLVAVQWTGGDGLSWLKTLAARIAAARYTVEQVAGAWTAIAIAVLMLAYFLVARARIARFRQLLSAAIDRQLEAIEAARAAGRWKVLDPSPEMIEIEADLAALENSLGTLGPQTPQAKAVKRQLEELWGGITTPTAPVVWISPSASARHGQRPYEICRSPHGTSPRPSHSARSSWGRRRRASSRQPFCSHR